MKSALSAIHNFDVAVTRWVQKSPAWMGPVFAYGTHLGDAAAQIALAVMTAGYFLLTHNLVLTKAYGLACAGMLVISGLKEVFKRARPDNEYAALQKGYSFPSGHAGHSAAFFGLSGYLILSLIGGPWAVAGAIVCLVISLLIGTSRIYLGAHFPSDVLAAWCIALLVVIGTVRLLGF